MEEKTIYLIRDSCISISHQHRPMTVFFSNKQLFRCTYTHTTKAFEMQTKPSFFTLSLANALVYTYAMNRMWKKIHSRFSSSILTFIFVFTLLHFLRLFTLFLCGTHNFWHMDVWEYVWICANKAQTKYIVYVIGVFTLAILFGLRLINRTGIGLFFLCFVPASLAWALNI